MNIIEQDNESVNGASAEQNCINRQILNELKQLNGRTAKVDEKVENQHKGLVISPKLVNSTTSTVSQYLSDGDFILPSLNGLGNSRLLQSQVNQRLQEPQVINFQGKLRSQGGKG